MFHRKVVEEVIPVETVVWDCSSDSCITWVRDNFKNAETPSCPVCKSDMVQSTRLLPAVENPLKPGAEMNNIS